MHQATSATKELQFQVSVEVGARGRFEGEMEVLRERFRSDETNTQTRMKGAQTYHSNVVSNKDVQTQALRSQVEEVSESRSRED